MATAPEVPNFAQFNFVEGDTIAMITKQNGQNASLVTYGQGLEAFGEEIEQEQAAAIQAVETIRDEEVIPARDAAQSAATAASESEQQAEYWADQAAGSVADGYIDDSVTATNKTWSSSKIDARLNADRDPTISFDFARDEYFIDNGERTFAPAEWAMTVERASPKWVMGPNGQLREVPPNTIAREWDPVTGECLGALIEGEATNLLSWSEDFMQSVWILSPGVTFTANAGIAPDGSNSATRFQLTGVNQRFYQAVSVPAGAQVASSIYIKGTTGETIRFDGSTLNLNGTWQRLQSVPNTDAGTVQAGNIGTYGDATARDVLIWGAQLEEGSTPSSYIPTQDAPVTRAADNVSRELGAEFNANGFAVFIDIAEFSKRDKIDGTWFTIDDGTDTQENQIDSRTGGGDGSVYLRLRLGGANLVEVDAANAPEAFKVAYAITPDAISVYIDGQLRARSSSFSANDVTDMLGKLTRLRIGSRGTTAASMEFVYGATAFYPHALSEAKLIELTQ